MSLLFKNKRLFGILASLVAALAFAGSVVFTKIGLNEGSEPFSFTFVSLLFTTLFVLPWFLSKKNKVKSPDYWGLLLLGVITSVGPAIVVFGQQFTLATNAAFLLNLATPFTAIFAVFILKDKLSRSMLFSLVVIFVGAYLISTSGESFIPSEGDLWIIFATVFLGYANVLATQLVKKSSTTEVVFWRLVLGNAVLLVLVQFITGNIFSAMSSTAILNGLFLAVFLMGLYKAFNLIGTSLGIILVASNSIFAFILASILLGEVWVPIQMFGGGLVLLGIILASKGS